MKRKEYIANYQKEGDEYVYKGEQYVFDESQISYKSARKTLYGFSFLLFFLEIGLGLIPSSGMLNTFYVILPYAITVVLTTVLIYRIWNIANKDGKIPDYYYEKYADGLRGFIKIILVFATMTLVGEVVHAFIEKPLKNPIATGIGIGFEVLIVIITFFFIRNVLKIKWKKFS